METLQKPLHTGFTATSTAAEVAAGHDLTGKVAIVTGGNSGIGFETVKALSDIGAHIVVGARDGGKAGDRLAGLKNVSFIPLDLSDPASVDTFAKSFLASHDRLHLLINNAGLFAVPELQKDRRGYELQFGVNHLGHFQLTGRLWPALAKAGATNVGAANAGATGAGAANAGATAAGGARVVVVSSIGHRRMDVHLDDLNFDKHPYDKLMAYGQSKTANVLFAVGLDRVGQAHGVRAYALHPGGIQTDAFRYMTEEERREWNERVMNSGTPFKTIEQGAATSVWCAVSEALQDKGGVYCQDCDIAELSPEGSPVPLGVRPYAVDPDRAAALWRLSEAATGVRYP
jgi:NAD(P)-dependent dehydrogenase (short-subunit alcohol dehydrogenase family)